MGDVGRAVQVHVHHDVPVVQAHVLERLVAQDACVVHQDMYGAESLHGIVDDGLRTFAGRYRGLVCNGLAACRTDLCNHQVSSVTGAGTVAFATQVIHENLGATARELECVGLAQAVAGAGDDNDFVFELTHLMVLLLRLLADSKSAEDGSRGCTRETAEFALYRACCGRCAGPPLS